MLQRLRDARRGQDASPRGAHPALASAPMSTRLSTADWTGLRRAIAGDVLVPGAAGYEAVRRPPIARFHDVRPQAIVRCARPPTSPRRSRSPAARARARGAQRRALLRRPLLDRGRADRRRPARRGLGRRRRGDGRRRGAARRRLRRAGRARPDDRGGLRPDGRDRRPRARRRPRDPRPPARADLRPARRRARSCSPTAASSTATSGEHADLFWALRGAGGCQFGVRDRARRSARVPAPRATTLQLRWPHADAAAVARRVAGVGARRARRARRQPARRPPARTRPAAARARVRRHARRRGRRAALLDAGRRRAARSRRRPTLRELPYRRGQAPPRRARRPASEAAPDAHGFAKSEFFRRPLPAGRDRRAASTHLAAGRAPGRARARLHALGRRVQPRPPPTPPRSRTAPSGSCSSTTSPSRPERPTRERRATGWRARGRWSTRRGPAARTRTSPIRSSTTGPAPTTAPTSTASRVKARYDPDDVFGAIDRREPR